MQKLNKKNIEDIIPLSSLQEGMLFHYLKEPESESYFEQLSLKLSGDIHIALFEQAWNKVVQNNEMLRTVFRWNKLKTPVQIILNDYLLEVKFHDISTNFFGTKNATLHNIKLEDRKSKFNLENIPFRVILCKLDDYLYEMIISNHHIIYDGWSTGIIIKEFFHNYITLFNGKQIQKINKVKFKKYLQFIKKLNKESLKDFWSGYLDNYNLISNLNFLSKNTEKKSHKGKYLLTIPENLTSELKIFLQSKGLTIATLIYVTWGILLQKYNNTKDIIFGTTISGRNVDMQNIENVVGLFINTPPLRVRADPQETVKNLINKIHQDLQTRSIYELSPLIEIKGLFDIDSREELFDTIVVIENYPLNKLLTDQNTVLQIQSYSMHEMTNYDLVLSVSITDVLNLSFVHNLGRLSKEIVAQIAQHFQMLLASILINYDKPLANLTMLTKNEIRNYLTTFNQSESQYPRDKLVYQLFELQAEQTPNNIAVIYKGQSLSYGELNARANQLAWKLRRSGIISDSLVGIMLERSPEYIVGILGILKSGGAYVPIDLDYPGERIEYIIQDSQIDILLTQSRNFHNFPYVSKIVDLDDEMLEEEDTRNLYNQTKSSDLAYVIYTSGSTGTPKGVMVEHRALLNYIYWGSKVYVDQKPMSFPLFTTISFDLTITSIYTPLITGNKIIIYHDNQNDLLIQTILKENQVDILKVTPSHLKIIKDMDNCQSRISKIIVGGEQLKTDLAKQIYESFGKGVQIYNEYGPTEATVGCMIYKYDYETDKRYVVPIGAPIDNMRIYLLDQYGSPVPENAIGEIFIGGIGVARGYLNKSELTIQRFLESPFVPGEKLYRTGDLARRFPEGIIEFIGRNDKQVKVRGYRIELEEIAGQLIQHDDIQDAIVVVRQRDDEEYVCAYIESNLSLSLKELKAYISKFLPKYMIPSFFVQVENFPLTINGKVDISQLPDSFEKLTIKEGVSVNPTNKVEEKLIQITARILNLDPQILDLNSNFYQLGGHSLKAVRLKSQIYKEFNIDLPLIDLMESDTLQDVADKLHVGKYQMYKPIPRIVEDDYYEISSAQKRIWILSQIEDASLSFIMSDSYVFEEAIDIDHFKKAIGTIIERHESLRTIFVDILGEVKQKILTKDQFNFQVEILDLSQESNVTKKIKYLLEIEKNTLFNLAKGPLLRAKLICLTDAKYLFIFSLHHIIADLISCNILRNEVLQIYNAYKNGRSHALEPLKIQYKDYVEWENNRLKSGELQELEEYWLNKFRNGFNIVELPIDFPRPALQTHNGETITFKLSAEQFRRIKSFSRANDATIFITILTVVDLLLYFYTGQTDIVLGTPASVRDHPDLENQIGIFLSTLALRTQFSEKDNFIQVLNKVKKVVFEAFQHQSYPFDQLIEILEIPRDISRHPMFDIMIDMIQVDESSKEGVLGDFKTKMLSEVTLEEKLMIESTWSKFDLLIYIYEAEEHISFGFEYNTDLFKRKTIIRMIERFKKLITGILEYPEENITELDINTNVSMPSILQI